MRHLVVIISLLAIFLIGQAAFAESPILVNGFGDTQREFVMRNLARFGALDLPLVISGERGAFACGETPGSHGCVRAFDYDPRLYMWLRTDVPAASFEYIFYHELGHILFNGVPALERFYNPITPYGESNIYENIAENFYFYNTLPDYCESYTISDACSLFDAARLTE